MFLTYLNFPFECSLFTSIPSLLLELFYFKIYSFMSLSVLNYANQCFPFLFLLFSLPALPCTDLNYLSQPQEIASKNSCLSLKISPCGSVMKSACFFCSLWPCGPVANDPSGKERTTCFYDSLDFLIVVMFTFLFIVLYIQIVFLNLLVNLDKCWSILLMLSKEQVLVSLLLWIDFLVSVFIDFSLHFSHSCHPLFWGMLFSFCFCSVFRFLMRLSVEDRNDEECYFNSLYLLILTFCPQFWSRFIRY